MSSINHCAAIVPLELGRWDSTNAEHELATAYTMTTFAAGHPSRAILPYNYIRNGLEGHAYIYIPNFPWEHSPRPPSVHTVYALNSQPQY